MMRIRRGWRQRDVGARAGLSASSVARHENGLFGSLRALEQHAATLDLRVDVRMVGRAGELARLGDEEHAALVEWLAGWLRDAGFLADAEVSFNEWGERGRVDLLAYEPRSRTLVILEVKTMLVDLQELLGSLDVKERLAPGVAARRGWPAHRRVTVLAVAATAANRTVIRSHPALFASFRRTRLGAEILVRTGGRLLLWVAPQRVDKERWIAGRQRVRPSQLRGVSH